MIAVDTNVLVRVLVGDDPQQTKKAERAFVTHATGGGIFLSLLVLMEVGWVLRSAYGWERPTIHARLWRLARTRGVVCEELDVVEAALEAYRTGKADLSDCLIVAKAKSMGAELLTFDRQLAKEHGVTLL